MAGFTRFNRKAALLLAKLGERGIKDGNKRITALGGITLNAVRYWRRSDEEYRGSQAVSDGLKAFLNISDTRNLLSNDVSVKDFSILLGYTTQQARELIDKAYDELYPAYSLFYSNERAAQDIVDRFQALHLVYRVDSGDRVKEFTGRDSNIVQIPLTVRYITKGTKPTISALYRVRCKLNIPSYTASTPFFEYDGYITPQKYDTHYWLFENRSEENKDLLFMITDSLQVIRQHQAGQVQEHNYSQGVMITRRQDAWPIHKVWKVVILKIENSDSGFFTPPDISDSESQFMTSQCKVVSKDDVPSWIVDKLTDEWEGIDFSSISR